MEETMDGNTTTTVVEEVKDAAAVLAELRRAQEDLKALRAENKSLKETVDNAPSVDEWRNRAITAETRNALNAQGIKDADRLMKYVGTEGLDFDENGKLTGLDERLSSLKKDLPEVFEPKRRVGGRGDIFANDSVEAKQDPLRESVRQALSH